MSFQYDSYCGLYCGACQVMGANERGDTEWLQKFAAEHKCTPQDLICHGCKSPEAAIVCADCPTKVCAESKGVEFCFECAEFPCQRISDFRNDKYPHHSAIFRNLAAIKAQGVEAWLEGEKKRWACPQCGERFYWYSEKCAKCGTELYNATKEEPDITI
jgi:hypothetical protein